MAQADAAGTRVLLTPSGGSAEALAKAVLDPQHLQQAVDRIGPGPAGWAVEEAAAALELVADGFSHIPDLPVTEIALSLETLMLNLAAALTIGPGAPGVPLSLIAPMTRNAARRDVPFAEVVRSMREVQARSLTRLLTSAAGSAPRVELVAATVTQVFDAVITRFVEIYLAEREALLESQVARRRALVEALVNGEHLEAQEVRRELGLDLVAFHTGLVLVPAGGSAGRDSARIDRSLRSAVPGASVLLLPAARGQLWAWLTTPEHPGEDVGDRVGRAVDGIAGLRCTLGVPARGASGFRRTHVQARDLEAWSRMTRQGSGGVIADRGREERVVSWPDHALGALLSRDPERARWFVEAALGPLAECTAAAEEHRLTLQAYLDSGRSLQRAAQLRAVHRNTVVYRIQRIEQLLGRPLGEREVQVQCALLLARDLGELVLRGTGDESYPGTTATRDPGLPAQ